MNLDQLLIRKAKADAAPEEVRSKFRDKYNDICAEIDKAIDASYEKLKIFHKKHIYARTEADWQSLANDLGQIQTDFERTMSVVIVQEIERVYKENKSIKESKGQPPC